MENVFRALGDPRRLEIVQLIGLNEIKAGEIAGHFPNITRPAVSQHLRVLVGAGVLAERRDGTRRLYRVRPEGFESIERFIEQFWGDRLARLKRVAEAEQQKET